MTDTPDDKPEGIFSWLRRRFGFDRVDHEDPEAVRIDALRRAWWKAKTDAERKVAHDALERGYAELAFVKIYPLVHPGGNWRDLTDEQKARWFQDSDAMKYHRYGGFETIPPAGWDIDPYPASGNEVNLAVRRARTQPLLDQGHQMRRHEVEITWHDGHKSVEVVYDERCSHECAKCRGLVVAQNDAITRANTVADPIAVARRLRAIEQKLGIEPVAAEDENEEDLLANGGAVIDLWMPK